MNTQLSPLLAEYVEFAKKQIVALGCFNVEPDALVWHYTTGAGIKGIVESGTIFATQVSCLNDSTEILYAVSLLRRSLTNILPKHVNNPGGALIEKYLRLLQHSPEYPAHAPSPHFVCCFSEIEDDLSQWRAYSGGENGYAIGIRVRDLFGVSNGVVARVSYDDILHEKLASEVAEATVESFLSGLEKNPSQTPDQWEDEFLMWWDIALSFISPMLKDPGFKSEREYRIVRPWQETDLPLMEFVQKSTMMSRHVRLVLPAGGGSQVPKLPISKILVGPCRHKEISRISVDTLMRKMGYPSGLVFSSKRPFQQL